MVYVQSVSQGLARLVPVGPWPDPVGGEPLLVTEDQQADPGGAEPPPVTEDQLGSAGQWSRQVRIPGTAFLGLGHPVIQIFRVGQADFEGNYRNHGKRRMKMVKCFPLKIFRKGSQTMVLECE